MPKATKAEYPLISEEISKGRQDLVFMRLFNMGDHKLKIHIVSDSYDFQSSAQIEIFHPSELKWNTLHRIHYSKMQTPSSLAYKTPQVGVEAFQKDIDTLIGVAKQVLA